MLLLQLLAQAGAKFQDHSQHHPNFPRMLITTLPILLFADGSSFFSTWPPPKLQDSEDFRTQLVFLCVVNRRAAASAAAISGTRDMLRGKNCK